MSENRIITQLTPEQEALIPVYREKWRNIALSTEPIDREKAAEAVKAAYALIGLPEPEILFYVSPYAVGSDKELVLDEHRIYGELYKIKKIYNEDFTSHLLWSLIECDRPNLNIPVIKLKNRLFEEFFQAIEGELYQLFLQIPELVRNQLWDEQDFRESQFEKQLDTRLRQLGILKAGETNEPFINYMISSNSDDLILSNIFSELNLISQENEQLEITFGNDTIYITPDRWVGYVSLYDFCINVLNCRYKQREWEVLQSISNSCGIIFPFEKLVIICDRPTKLSFDTQTFLHAEADTAIEFADGFKMYAHHGVNIPEKYGKIHPHQWEAKWLLTEDNAELRRVLIQGIGYSKICQELQAIELGSWQEYTLLKIDNNIDIEPIYLLKMTCPSTGYIHALRVPPNIQSAKEAIRWVNWGIDPEEFSVQT